MFAHSRNAAGARHRLVDHLRETARLTGEFVEALGARDLGSYLGLWHDVGKFDPAWQRYLLDAEAGRVAAGHGPDHKAAGASMAAEAAGLPALVIQGHHGGLLDAGQLKAWLADTGARAGAGEALRQAEASMPDLRPRGRLPLPPFLLGPARGPQVADLARASELFIRLLFSALVDADSLDTERHASPERADLRGHDIDVGTLCGRLDDALAAFPPSPSAPVREVRTEILAACRAAAELPPGLFRLAAPTGGGKTLSGLAFALRHARRHGLRRVIVAVPYISITEQTAGVYRSVLGDGDDGRPAVLEHHSGSRELVQAGVADPAEGDCRPDALWGQLASENWDAPLVVTTTVQLFESLFSRTRTACRKLHRLARSVIVLDEVQALPVPLLDPILDVLRELCEYYGTTVLLSTATLPAFDAVPALTGLPARDVLPDPAPLFRRLARVRYDWRTDEPLPWASVADLIGAEGQALAVLNTKRDALALLDALGDVGEGAALHLSTLLCGAHRRRVLADVRRRLQAEEPCLLVSTQVVEAGVDLDFPLVLRALGPLDGIIQAAGRCNREGRLGLGDEARGRLIVFRPEGGGMPSGTYKLGAQIAEMLVQEARRNRTLDPNDPALYRRYSEMLLQLAGTDGANIQRFRASLDYPAVARAFRMIDDDTESVVVTTYGSAEERLQVRSLLDGLRDPRRGAVTPRAALRMLQPYVVTVRRREAKAYRQRGLLEDVHPTGRPDAGYGLAEWHGGYDEVRGLAAEGASADAFVV